MSPTCRPTDSGEFGSKTAGRSGSITKINFQRRRRHVVVVVLFLVRGLGLSAGLVGLVIAAGGIAGIVGATIGVPITHRLGNGPTFILGMTLSSLAGLVMAAAAGPAALALSVVIVAQLLRGWGPTLYGINQQTIRQVLVPPELLARTQATWRFLVFGMQPVGALLGGTLGALVGFRATLVISSLIMLIGTSCALFSPLRTLRRLPGADVPRPAGDAAQPTSG